MSISQLKAHRAGALRTTVFIIAALLLIGALSFAFSDTVRFVVSTLGQYAVFGQPSEKDREDAKAMVDQITTVHHFEMNSRSKPGQPPVFVSAGSRLLLTQPTAIQIYDVLDSAEQDHIITALQSFIRTRNLPPVRVQFFVYENWIQNGGFGSRGSETQIRRIYVDAKHIKEEAGTEQINYPSL